MNNRKISIGIFPVLKGAQKYIDQLSNVYNIHIIEPKVYDETELNKWVAYCKDNQIVSVTAFEQDQIFFQTLINERLGAPSLSKQSCLYSINKFLNRRLETKPFWYNSVWLSESNTTILSKIKEYPCMLKSTLHNMGAFIFKINDSEALLKKIDELRNSKAALEENSANYQRFCSNEFSEFPYLIVEKYMDIQFDIKQFSIDCYSTSNGQFQPFVVREEIYFANFQKIGYLCPPPSLDTTQLHQLEIFVHELGKKFHSKGHVNQFFNIECWLTSEGKFYLTEINPIPNTNFSGMYWLMEGKSLFKEILDLHHRQIEPENTPFKKIKDGMLKKFYLQTEINCAVKGKASNIFDFNAIQLLSKNERYHLECYINEDFEFTDIHMSIPGWPVAELYLEDTTIDSLLAQDKQIRKMIYKD